MGTTDDNILGKEIIEICMFHDATASCPLAHSPPPPPLPSCHANTEKICTSVLKGLGRAKKGHRGSMAQKLVRDARKGYDSFVLMGYDCPGVEAEISLISKLWAIDTSASLSQPYRTKYKCSSKTR